jgi:ribose transport system ATP-binding protein
VVVMHDGEIKKEMTRKEIKSEEELQYAIQGF